MTATLIVALAVVLTVADGIIAALGRQLADRDASVELLIRTLGRLLP
jgi:hypothetical protein